MTININDIEIKIKLLKSDTVLAQATLFVCHDIEIKGWKVLKANRPHRYLNAYLWFQAPSIRAGSSWTETIFINNEPLFRELEEKIYKTYLGEKEKAEALDEDRSKYEFTEADEKRMEAMYAK